MSEDRGGESQVTQSGSCPDQAGALPAPAPSRTRRLDSPRGNTPAPRRAAPDCSSLPAKSARAQLKITEKQFQERVIALAQLTGHKVAHFRPARTKNDEWRTPVAADGRGFPDLVLVGRGKVIFAELKSESGTATTHQLDWLEQIKAAGGHAYLWRPSDWDVIEALLTARPTRPS